MPTISAHFCPFLVYQPISQKKPAAVAVMTRLTTGVIWPLAAISLAMLVTPSPKRKPNPPFPSEITAFTTERMAIQSNQLAAGLILARAAVNCNRYAAWGSFMVWPMEEKPGEPIMELLF